MARLTRNILWPGNQVAVFGFQSQGAAASGPGVISMLRTDPKIFLTTNQVVRFGFKPVGQAGVIPPPVSGAAPLRTLLGVGL